MRRRSVPIPWAATTVDQLQPAERARLAGTWMRRSEAEYLAVSTFSVLAIDLVAAMAPADVISLCLRAGIDEIRHAEMCMRMVEIYSGEQKLPPPGMSSLPDDPTKPKLHQALANTMLVSCVSETYATTVLSATRELTLDPTAQAVLTSIYSDEVMHARLGWSYMRYAIETGGEGVIAAAAEMLPRALRGVANVVERERPIGDVTQSVRDHGLMTPAEERVIFSTCVREVLVPGFEALGIPVGSAMEDYGDQWARAA
ncbi:MAG TPA: ferritin-like domain-containing protein [Kofleriaceae bacterium]